MWMCEKGLQLLVKRAAALMRTHSRPGMSSSYVFTLGRSHVITDPTNRYERILGSTINNRSTKSLSRIRRAEGFRRQDMIES